MVGQWLEAYGTILGSRAISIKGVPLYRRCCMVLVRENPNPKWMITRGTPIYGNQYIYMYSIYIYSIDDMYQILRRSALDDESLGC